MYITGELFEITKVLAKTSQQTSRRIHLENLVYINLRRNNFIAFGMKGVL